MKNFKIYIFFLAVICSFVACSDNDDDAEEQAFEAWKIKNTEVFNQIASNAEYTKLQSLSNNYSLYYKVLTEGGGAQILYTDTANVYYKGTFVADYTEKKLTAGEVFMSKLFEDGTSVAWTVNNPSIVISSSSSLYLGDGIRTALQYMKVGDKWLLYIPYQLAFGENGTSVISMPGYSTVAFEIEVVSKGAQ